MEKIEILKSLLNKHIFRTHSPNPQSRGFMCLHTYPAVLEINKKYPGYSIDFLLQIISQQITIKEGRWTTFVWGYTRAARLIINSGSRKAKE
jgi:hypothetical protein